MLAMAFGIILFLIPERLRSLQAWWNMCDPRYQGIWGKWIIDHRFFDLWFVTDLSELFVSNSWEWTRQLSQYCWIEQEKSNTRSLRRGKTDCMERGWIVFFVSMSSFFGFSKQMLMFILGFHPECLHWKMIYNKNQQHTYIEKLGLWCAIYMNGNILKFS